RRLPGAGGRRGFEPPPPKGASSRRASEHRRAQPHGPPDEGACYCPAGCLSPIDLIKVPAVVVELNGEIDPPTSYGPNACPYQPPRAIARRVCRIRGVVRRDRA